MNDLISRKAALSEIGRSLFVGEAYRKVRQIPIEKPEQKKGRWIDAILPSDNGDLPVQVCDQCNTFFPLMYTGGGHNYCPNCGARMEVEKGWMI